MYILAGLGPVTERVLGGKRFLRFYLFTGVVGGLLITLFDPSNAPVLGASGAISGVLVAFAIFFPDAKLGLLFIPIQFKARQFVIGLGILSAVLVVGQMFNPAIGGSISHFGHLAGMIAALLFYFVYERLIKHND